MLATQFDNIQIRIHRMTIIQIVRAYLRVCTPLDANKLYINF